MGLLVTCYLKITWSSKPQISVTRTRFGEDDKYRLGNSCVKSPVFFLLNTMLCVLVVNNVGVMYDYPQYFLDVPEDVSIFCLHRLLWKCDWHKYVTHSLSRSLSLGVNEPQSIPTGYVRTQSYGVSEMTQTDRFNSRFTHSVMRD